jgi:CHAD domain-containing protein
VTQERELKLSARSNFAMPDLTGIIKGSLAQPLAAQVLDAAYYDTEQFDLARAGTTLRHRSGEPVQPWTLKLPRSNRGGLLSREELSWPGRRGAVPVAARDLVRALTRGRPLVLVGELQTARQGVEVRARDGRRLATVVEDRVRVIRPDHAASDLHEVEVELAATGGRSRHLLEGVSAALVAAGCERTPGVPKIIQALGADAVVADPLSTGSAIGDRLQHCLQRSVDRIGQQDPWARQGDAEAVHQLRVAVRNLRSDLRLFSPPLGPGAADLEGELAWFGLEVGAARDADVRHDRLLRGCSSLSAVDADGADALLSMAAAARSRAQLAMLVALRSSRYDALLDALSALACAPVDARVRAKKVHHRADRLWRQLQVCAGATHTRSTDAELHAVRKLAKRNRSAAVALGGHHSRRFATSMTRIQDVLGELQDAVVTETWLREAAREEPACALVAGELIAGEHRTHDLQRAAWPRVWRATRSIAPPSRRRSS